MKKATIIIGGPRINKEPTIAKRYKMTRGTLRALRTHAHTYGSQGRALQVATEILIRTARVTAKRPAYSEKNAAITAMTYKIFPRTAQIIDQLAEKYGSRAVVLDVCACVLDPEMKIPRLEWN